MSASALDITCDISFAKVRAPRHTPAMIDRDEALAELKRCLSCKIVTIEAPLGFAKTNFLAEAHRRLGEDTAHYRTAWLSADASDDHERLSRHIMEAWKHVWPELDSRKLTLLYRQDPERYIISVSNFLIGSANDPALDYVLFIDNLHLVDSRDASLLLDQVAEYFPANYHVVASGNYLLRERVGLAFRDEACTFPDRLLAFSPEEVERVLKASGVPTEAPEGRDFDFGALAWNLWDVTRGWPLGVLTYADALACGAIDLSSAVDHRSLGKLLNRFFHDGVLDSLPADSQEFAVMVALPDRVSAELCDAMTGRRDSKYLLRDLRVRGCYLESCEGMPGWYEYSPLFRRWLRRKQEQLGTESLHDVCHAASRWFESHGMVLEAAKCMLMTAEPAFVEDMASAMGYESTRDATPFFSWTENTPISRFAEDPQVALQVAWAYLSAGRIDEALHWTDRFERYARVVDDGHVPDLALITGLMHNKCLEMQCRYAEAIEASERYLEEHADRLTLQQRYLLMQSMAEAYMRLGRFDEALKNYLQAEVMAELGKSALFVALCRVSIVRIRLSQGRFKDAPELVEKSLRECPDTIMVHGLLLAYKGYILAETGHLEEANDYMERARESVSGARNIDMMYECCALRASCLQAMGEGALAFRIITKAALEIGDAPVARSVDLQVALTQGWVALGMGYIQEAQGACCRLQQRRGESDTVYRLAAADLEMAIEDACGDEGRAEDAVALAEEARAEGLHFYEMCLCIRAAERFARAGARSDALVYLGRALRLQAGQHIVGPFLRVGGHVRSLLHEIVDVRKSGGEIRQLAKAVLREFGNDEGEAATALTAGDSPAARFGLTEREMEVLDLLDAGLSRREIAEALTVSLNTVKSHVSSIYTKLGVTNRVDAFAMVHGEGDGR